MTTKAAEGLERRRWTVAEIEAMAAAGIIRDDERFELIGGEVVPMSPKGIRHEVLKVALARLWFQKCPASVGLAPETTLRLDASSYVEPDFVFYPAEMGLAGLTPETALLAVEIADTSLSFDLGRKIEVYAGARVREVWVIDAVSLETHIHAQLREGAYRAIRTIEPSAALAPSFADELAVKLADLALR